MESAPTSSAPAIEPPSESGLAHPEVPLDLPEHLNIEGDAERKAEAASYSKLVSTFLRTDFESTRKRVARRLQAARTSDDEITRYLAEAALARLRDEGQYAAYEDALNDSAQITN
jgi:hypothetical protein